jgi:hypothetical protein
MRMSEKNFLFHSKKLDMKFSHQKENFLPRSVKRKALHLIFAHRSQFSLSQEGEEIKDRGHDIVRTIGYSRREKFEGYLRR